MPTGSRIQVSAFSKHTAGRGADGYGVVQVTVVRPSLYKWEVSAASFLIHV